MFTVSTEHELELIVEELKIALNYGFKSDSNTVLDFIKLGDLNKHCRNIIEDIYVSKLSTNSRYMIFVSAIKMYTDRINHDLKDLLLKLDSKTYSSLQQIIRNSFIDAIAKVKKFDCVRFYEDVDLTCC